MKKTPYMLIAGIGLLIIAVILLINGIIWYYGWGGGLLFILIGIFGDKSTPEEKPRKIAQNFKEKVKCDVDKVNEIISDLSGLPEEWNSKKDPERLRAKVMDLANMSTGKIRYKFGNSLITYFQVSFTKSKDTYMVSFEGEGEQSAEIFEEKFSQYFPQ